MGKDLKKINEQVNGAANRLDDDARLSDTELSAQVSLNQCLDVCIADDEALIQKSIIARLRVCGTPVRVLGCADNAESAISLYRAWKPDIFFVNINIPGIDGLSLVRRIREEDTSCVTKFIIITGYDDFRHMQEAIRSGVMDYLKKPITTEEFNAVLATAAKAVQQEHRSFYGYGEKEGAIYYDEYIVDSPRILNGGSLIAAYTPSASLFGEIPNFGQQKDCLCFKFQGIENIRLYYNPGTPIPQRNLLQSLIPLAQSAELSFVYAYPESERLDILAEKMEQTMNTRFLRVGLWECGSENSNVSVDMGILDYALDHGQNDACHSAITTYFERVTADESLVWELSPLYRQIILLLFNKYAKHHIPIPEHLKLEFSLFALCRYPNLKALWTHLCGTVEALAQKIGSKRRSGELIHSVCEYLSSNYREDVSLNELAAYFYVSPPYLSRRFREKTGNTLGEYLEDIRMEKAREYLEQSESLIIEVAEQVGYLDPNYFAKVFKKKYHLSPSDYRLWHKGR